MTGVKDWDATTASNNDDASLADDIDWREGQSPSTVNNSSRAMMKLIAAWFQEIQGGTNFIPAANVAGTANAITLTTTQAETYAAGQRFAFIAEANNTGAVTVAVDGQAATAVKRLGSALAASDILSGDFILLVHDGVDFELVYPDRSSYLRTLFDANTILAANTDNTPAALTVAEERLVGRITSGNIAALTAAQVRAFLDYVPGSLVAVIEDQKASGTDGGTFTSGADRTRTLNTEVFDANSLFSVGTNQITVPAGDWIIEWSAPAFRVGLHQSFLYDITGTAEVARGTSQFSHTDADTPGTQTVSGGVARVSPSGANVYEIRHRCATTNADDGFGQAASLGTEVYTQVKIYVG